MVKLLPEKLYRKIYSKVLRLCIDVIVKNKQGILLSKRVIPPCKGMWHIPGATMQIGENSQECAKRVAKYETGLKIKIVKFLGIKEYSRKSGFGQAVSIVYLAKPIGGKLNGSIQGRDVRFFKKLPKNIIKEQKNILYRYFKLR